MTSRQMHTNHRRTGSPSSSSQFTMEPSGTSSANPQSVTQRKTTSRPLNFKKAMSDFHTMFPELDRDVIEAVLRANNGVVQTTIDQLLELQESTIVERAQSDPVLPSYEHSIGEGEEPPPAYNDIWEDVGPPQPDPLFPNSRNEPSNLRKSPKTFPRNTLWNAPLIGVLPDDFLRLDTSVTATNTTNLNNSNNILASSGSAANVGAAQGTNSKDFMTDDDVERFLEDEKLAIFLQNEEFLRELRRNREFVTSLEAGGMISLILRISF